MIRLFKESEDIQALVSVACCYMKLTTDFEEKDKTLRICTSDKPCYPMSSFVKSMEKHRLPYKARELACHAVEDFYLRLKGNTELIRFLKSEVLTSNGVFRKRSTSKNALLPSSTGIFNKKTSSTSDPSRSANDKESLSSSFS